MQNPIALTIHLNFTAISTIVHSRGVFLAHLIESLMRTVAEVTIVFFFILAMLGNAYADQDRRRVSFVPQWIPQAQFAGYYVAFEKGFYEKYGLEVNILRGGPERPSAEWLKKGAADFATMFLSTAIVERAKGTRLVNVGQIVSRSSQVLIAKKSSGINSWQDINGKKIGLWGAELSIMPTALFRRYGLQVTVIPQASTVNLFLRGGVDVVSAMWYNEYHAILNAGVEPEDLVVFRLSDLGFNLPEDGIYCLESHIQKRPAKLLSLCSSVPRRLEICFRSSGGGARYCHEVCK